MGFKDVNLYKILGLKSNATDQQIKTAYRLKSKKAHPDAGGTQEKFEELKLARDILLDPLRRKKYDNTGEIEPTAPDNSMSVVLAVISEKLDQAVITLINNQRDPVHHDLVDMITKAIRGDVQKLTEGVEGLMKAAEIWAKLAPRFKTKDGSNCLLHDMALSKVAQVTEGIRRLEAKKKAMNDALALLSNTVFTVEELLALRGVVDFGVSGVFFVPGGSSSSTGGEYR
jgi:hypothetical protein